MIYSFSDNGNVSQAELERNHSNGKTPDWYYYQKSDKPIYVKLNEQRQSIHSKVREQQAARHETELSKEDEEQLAVLIEKTLNELLKPFQ